MRHGIVVAAALAVGCAGSNGGSGPDLPSDVASDAVADPAAPDAPDAADATDGSPDAPAPACPVNGFVACGGDPTGTWTILDFCPDDPAAAAALFEHPYDDRPACTGAGNEVDGRLGHVGTASFDAGTLRMRHLTTAYVTYGFSDGCLAGLKPGMGPEAACLDVPVNDRLKCAYAGGACRCSAEIEEGRLEDELPYVVDGAAMTIGTEMHAAFCVDGDRLTLDLTPHPVSWRWWLFERGGNPPPPKTFPLVEGGKSAHRIVLEPGASPSEHTAAEELRAHVMQATGADLPVVTAPVTDGGPMIVLGAGATASGLGVAPAAAALGEQGFAIRAVPPHLVIAGTPAAGTLYGVHRFLEDVAGVRWLAPGVTRVPASPDLRVPESLDRLVQPAFLWRSTSYEWPGADDAFWARVGENAGGGGPDSPWGVEHAHDGRAHSYFWYVSPDEFFDTHPEYFSEIGGVRIREETQLCLTNPDVLEIVTERMLKRMADKPGVRQHNFSQKDHYNYCECDKCRAMNEKYGTAGGTQFWFVNQLAERTSKVHPDKLIGTLAYMYTEEPPKDLAMHPNVAVWLCHMFPSCDSHPIRTCADNADYKRRAEAWSKQAKHLYVWHYIVDFMHYYVPFPNLFALADNLRFYKEIGVEGIYLQAMGHAGGGGEFSLLRPYFAMRLAWDPELDPGELIDEFLDGYYGAASAPIRDWIDRIQAKVEDEGIHMHLYTNPAQGYLPDEVVEAGELLLDEAAALVAGDPVLEDRVAVARMPLMYARFFPRNGYRIEDGMLRWNPGMATAEDVVAFTDMMSSHGFQTVREVQGGPETMMMLWAIIGSDKPIVTIRNDALEADVVPALAGRALRITHRVTGKTVTAFDKRPNLFFPFTGGYEDRIGTAFDAMGWVEPASPSAATERSVTVTMTTFDGWKVSRAYELDAAEPVLRVATTVTNTGDAARDLTGVRTHLELDLGDVASTRMRFTARGGATVDDDMAGVIAGQREGRRFREQDAPAGEWTFSGTKGLSVTQSFDDASVDSAWVYAYPATLGEVEVEVWSPRTTLPPGGSVTVERALRVEAE